VPVGEEQPRPPVRVVVDAGCAAVGEEEGSAGSAVAPSVEEPGRRRWVGRAAAGCRRCRWAAPP
jgi:hypothetical protein